MQLPSTSTAAVGGRGRLVHSLRAAGRGVAPPIANIERNLVLAYHPGWQSLEDLNAIARHVSDIDSTIRTFIVPTTHRNPVTRKHAAQRPALIVSPGQMRVFRPLRGNVYQGGSIAKVEQVRRLEKAGVPVPRTEILTPDLRLDPQTWGEFVILKPTDIATSSRGLGIQLMRTNRVRYIPPDQYPSRHPGRYGPMIVQQFVDTGEYFMAHRCSPFSASRSTCKSIACMTSGLIFVPRMRRSKPHRLPPRLSTTANRTGSYPPSPRSLPWRERPTPPCRASR